MTEMKQTELHKAVKETEKTNLTFKIGFLIIVVVAVVINFFLFFFLFFYFIIILLLKINKIYINCPATLKCIMTDLIIMPSFKCIAQPASEKMTVTSFADRKHIMLIIIENVHSVG